jgi:hypothetical protein
MEYKSLVELKAVAQISFHRTRVPIARHERVERWIELLSLEGERGLRSLQEIEHLSLECRRACRADDSPLTVAYEDPLLCASGLRSDRVGDCMDFFEMTDEQMHDAFCSCNVGAKLTGSEGAERLRRALRRDIFQRHVTSTPWSNLRQIFRGLTEWV